LNCPDCLHILANYEHFFIALLNAADNAQTRDKIEKVKRVWERYYPLACLTSQAQVTINKAEWLDLAREFGQAFVNAHGEEEVTTYIHIFVYHFGFFLATYNGIKKFANYALEGKHRVIKHILAFGTSGFSYGPAEAARQQLCALLCLEQHTSSQPAAMTHFSSKSWAKETLTKHDSIKPFTLDSLIT